MAFQFVNKNLLKAEKINIGMFNTVFEQFLFYAMAEEKNITINCYFPEDAVNHAFDGLAEISSLPDKVKYVHTVGSYKKKQLTGEMLAFRLQSDYPDYYYEIMNLLRTNQI
jgi:hypothetical protein